MTRKPRPGPVDEARQIRFAWADRDRIVGAAPAGEVLFEAAELRPRARRAAPTVRAQPGPGLPFGVRDVDGTPVCWGCGKTIDEATVVRVGPGDCRCPGCGAKLPFVVE